VRIPTRYVLNPLLVLALTHALAARADDSDADALSLKSAPVEAVETAQTGKFFIEGALGVADQRGGAGSRNLGRASIDFSHTSRLAPGWQAVVSDRLDHLQPADIGSDKTVNSLREAYLTWQQEGSGTLVEFGRINLRYGPGYGYNPTDFFRDGALRTMTTVNPLALRENRLGTVVLHGQHLWSGGSVSVAYSPKLANGPSSDGSSLDLGATNNRDRALLALTNKISERVSSQFLLYKDRELPAQVGASMTGLLTDSAVAYAEWSRGREPDLLSRALGLPAQASSRNRFSGGVTYTTSSKLSVTAEYQYNGFALDRSGWNAASVDGVAALGAYLLEAQRRLDLASREAYLVYATQESFVLKNLDLTGLLRVNANDHSRLGWVELRYHWPRFDLAVQLQQQSGASVSEYGLAPYRRSAQLLAAYYFQ
jgi:hypothetical protein